ncbi:MAG: 50S ribosomal protein L11 methyltransferase [SAR324 cluster bacterium]|nr:50S ribosomal protein L11 methyltransferase [SAR324 cluster bacterium]
MRELKKESIEKNWYWELSAGCRADQFELVSFYFFEQGASGIEEIKEQQSSICFRVFFPAITADLTGQLHDIIKNISDLIRMEITIKSIEKKEFQNWQDGWRAFFKPMEIGATFLIRPPWEPSQSGKNEIVIYPGQGFGTGYHESTHLALLLLEWLLNDHQITHVIDVGTGSGILAIAALLLNADHITAIDIDPEALPEVRKNLALSGFDETACTLALSRPDALKVQAKLVMANIEGHILQALAGDLANLTSTDGYLLLSGVLVEQESSLLNCIRDQFVLIKTLRMGEWSGFVFNNST